MSDDPKQTERPETSLNARPERAGVAPIKPEYLVHATPTVDAASTSALNDTNVHADADDMAEGVTSGSSRDAKRRKTEGKGKKDRGQNKARSFAVIRESGPKICRQWELAGGCPRAEGCKFQHSWYGYFESKPKDLYFPAGSLRNEEPFVLRHDFRAAGEDEVGRTIDLDTKCPVKEDLGYCPYGWRCRYLGGHVERRGGEADTDGSGAGSSRDVIGSWQLTGWPTDEQKEVTDGWKQDETNWPDFELIQKLRGNKYHFTFSERYLAHIEPQKPFNLSKSRPPKRPNPESDSVLFKDGKADPPAPVEGMSEEEAAMGAMLDTPAAPTTNGLAVTAATNDTNGVVHGESDAMDVPLRPEEKKRLDWDDGLYLAPLTTVGNLPFRRLCTSYGATITISEMALAAPLVSGSTDEYALLRRHKSEKMYGVQLAGGFANRMVPAAELIGREFAGGGVDFVDVNLGCPIDLVFNQGAGSALLDSPGRLGKILIGMNRALGDIPLTVKFRTGVASGKPNAHKLIPRFASEWGASALTLHGRSRQQRYSKLADWSYIKQCSQTLRDTLSDAGLPKIPIFGNGDCFSAQSYYEEKEKSGVDGVMIARGALIKPWIFTEIAERREWDISAAERLDGIRKFAEFGLSHWGSDTQGISITRRFLCEFLSFTHRYIPIGLLERMPPMLNERPPAYRGRNELETLLASPFVGDWVKISEMFLGPVEEQWSFTPKHKSNAYGGEEAQG